MTVPEHRLDVREKIGYALGDAAANLVWRGALAFIAVFYTDTFGISAMAVSVLLLIVRLQDGLTDIIMGMIADRTTSRWGKFRPWVLFSAPLLGITMVLTFTTPDLGGTGKLIWAYVTYIALTLAYTANNVPYSALMGVMTPSTTERTSLSSWRFAGAFLGGFLVMVGTPILVARLGGGDDARGYQYTMYIFGVLLVVMLAITFATTKERVTPPQESGNLRQGLLDLARNLPYLIVPLVAVSLFFYYRELYSGILFVVVMAGVVVVVRRLIRAPESRISDIQRDVVDLLTNVPWIILIGIGFLFMMFNGIKIGATAYYFTHYVAPAVSPTDYFGWLPRGFISGEGILLSTYFAAVLAISIVGALCTGVLAKWIGAKNLFILSLFLGGLILGFIYFLGPTQIYPLFALGVASEFFAAIMPTLFFSMLGDCADYAEWRNRRRATGLVYSAGTFINKAGGGFAGALILMVLAAYGYDGMDQTTIAGSIGGMKALMSWIPSVFAFAGAAVMLFYPLSDARMRQIEADLAARRQG